MRWKWLVAGDERAIERFAWVPVYCKCTNESVWLERYVDMQVVVSGRWEGYEARPLDWRATEPEGK